METRKRKKAAKQKRKLTAAEKAEKKRRQKEYMTIFVYGKQKRVKRPPTIDGMDVDEFIRINADPIWLKQNEMYEELYAWEIEEAARMEEAVQFEEDARIEEAAGKRSRKKRPKDQ